MNGYGVSFGKISKFSSAFFFFSNYYKSCQRFYSPVYIAFIFVNLYHGIK